LTSPSQEDEEPSQEFENPSQEFEDSCEEFQVPPSAVEDFLRELAEKEEELSPSTANVRTTTEGCLPDVTSHVTSASTSGAATSPPLAAPSQEGFEDLLRVIAEEEEESSLSSSNFRTATDGWFPKSYDGLLRIVQTGMGWEDKLVTVSTALFVLRLARAEKCPAIKVSDLEQELAQVCSSNRKFTSSINHRRSL
jgi:hypothetical protein